jgi:hypothetical protein
VVLKASDRRKTNHLSMSDKVSTILLCTAQTKTALMRKVDEYGMDPSKKELFVAILTHAAPIFKNAPNFSTKTLAARDELFNMHGPQTEKERNIVILALNILDAATKDPEVLAITEAALKRKSATEEDALFLISDNPEVLLGFLTRMAEAPYLISNTPGWTRSIPIRGIRLEKTNDQSQS